VIERCGGRRRHERARHARSISAGTSRSGGAVRVTEAGAARRAVGGG
jgi:hypothetical protein